MSGRRTGAGLGRAQEVLQRVQPRVNVGQAGCRTGKHTGRRRAAPRVGAQPWLALPCRPRAAAGLRAPAAVLAGLSGESAKRGVVLVKRPRAPPGARSTYWFSRACTSRSARPGEAARSAAAGKARGLAGSRSSGAVRPLPMLRAPRHAGLAARLTEGLGRLLRAGAAQQGTQRQGTP